jgi:hypothetical protein
MGFLQRGAAAEQPDHFDVGDDDKAVVEHLLDGRDSVLDLVRLVG